ncbi:MAG: acyl-CoA dehydratase activase [Bacteroidales bacterium]|jgi:predicted CoA-substrate-specific enzyme activase|nr:acyl-CoA dehydratase activase [Bacteroidales bacterium]
MYRLGIDLGSSYTKGVLVDENNRATAFQCVKSGYNFNNASTKIINHFKEEFEIGYPVYTCGYGREQIQAPFVSNSELIALSKAVYNIYHSPCSIIDIGGQDTKFIQVNALGQVEKFKMNRKCAAGTGSFLEEIAFRLDVTPEEFTELAKEATQEVKINSFCTVFAISEIIGLIKNGASLPNIILGIYNSIILRSIELSLVEDHLVITGGLPVIHPTIVSLFKKRFPNSDSPEQSQFLAAYGCVLLNNEKKFDSPQPPTFSH